MQKIRFAKREELVILSFFLTVLMLIFYIIPLGAIKLISLPIFAILVYLTSLYAGREGLSKIDYFIVPILPIFFTIASALFYNIIPERWLTRIVFILTYGVLIYSIFLIINIFNAAKLKNIQLLKVARTIYFFISAFTLFLMTYVVLSFHFYNIISSLIISFFVFTVLIAYIKSFYLKERNIKFEAKLALFIAIILFEISFAVTFWPLNIYISALFITSVYYSITGIIDNILGYKIRGWSVNEYLIINILIFILAFFATNFG